MRIALFGDIHGNVVALDAVLAEIEREGADQVICLGDVAAGGPQPREALARVRRLGCPVIMGNGEGWMFDDQQPTDLPPDAPARQLTEIGRWCRSQLTADDLRYLKTFAPTVSLALENAGELLCFHGSPQSYFDILTATTPDADLDRMLAGAQATVLVGGHTHVTLLRRHRGALLVNPGSVGLPHGRIRSRSPIRIPAVAEYAWLTAEGGRLSVDFRRLPIDLAALRTAAMGSGMPHAEWWLERWASDPFAI